MVTPFQPDGRINFDRFRTLARYLVDNGSDGLVVTGTTGESPTLSDKEKVQLWEAAVDEVGDRATVIAGSGTNSTQHSIELTEKAHKVGVDGLLVVAPYYNKPPQHGIVEHFRGVASASDKPIIAYNIPGRCVINIEPATLVEIAEEIPTVRGVKQANADLDQARRIVAETDLALYAGDDNLVLPFLELGGTGGVCVHTHLVGPQVKEMIRRFREGDTAGAKRINDELGPIYELIGVVVGPIWVKTALNLLGQDIGGYRLPMVEATPAETERARACLERAGLLAAAPA